MQVTLPERKDLHRERALEICRRGPLSLWLSMHLQRYERKIPRARERNTSKRVTRIIPRAHIRLVILPVLTSQNRKIS